MNTTTVSIEIPTPLKERFETLEPIHLKRLSDALKLGMHEIINKTNTPEEILIEINKKELKLNQLRAELNIIRANQSPTGGSDFSFTDEYDLIIHARRKI